MCVKVVPSSIWKEFRVFCAVCRAPNWNWPGYVRLCPLGSQEKGLDLGMYSGRGVEG